MIYIKCENCKALIPKGIYKFCPSCGKGLNYDNYLVVVNEVWHLKDNTNEFDNEEYEFPEVD